MRHKCSLKGLSFAPLQFDIVLRLTHCEGARYDANCASSALALHPDRALCSRYSAQPFSVAFGALVLSPPLGTCG